MDWFKVTDTNNIKRIINANTIMFISYLEDTDMTEITFARSAYSPLFVKGNVMRDIERLLSSHDHYVSTITT